MAARIRKVNYFYASVRDQPGEGYRLLTRLAGAGVNLLAFTATPVGPECSGDVMGLPYSSPNRPWKHAGSSSEESTVCRAVSMTSMFVSATSIPPMQGKNQWRPLPKSPFSLVRRSFALPSTQRTPCSQS